MTYHSQWLFPVPVIYTENSAITDARLQTICRDMAKAHGAKTFECPCLTTIASKNQVLSMPEFTEAKRTAIAAVLSLAEFWKVNTENLEIVDSWVNLYEPTGYQDLHMHHNSVISGCMYVASSGNNDLWFQAPWHIHQPVIPHYRESDLTNCHNVYFPSIAGRCYAWPSYLLHKTTPATTERISISFNATYVCG